MTGIGDSFGQPKARRGVKRLQHRLGQRDLAAQRRVHRILKQLVVQQTVAANRMKVRLCINQNAVVSGCDVAVDLLEGGQAAHRIAVSIPGRDVVLIGLVPRLFLLEQPGEAEVRLGKARVLRQERSIALDGGVGVLSVSSRRAAMNSRWNDSRSAARRRRRQE